MHESSSPDSLRRDDFYQANLWLGGTGSLNNAVESNSKTATDDKSMESVANSKTTTRDAQNAQNDRECVDVTNMSQTAPFKDIDIRPVLSEFAIKQCKLAAFYRKTDRSNFEKTTRAVGLLRSALRKCRFESTIRALYDLSGCYVRGLGVQEDSIMGRLLRYCAGGMRRNYDTRGWWLRRLVMEIGFRPDEAPERSIAAMALLCRWRPVVISQEEMRNYLEVLVLVQREIDDRLLSVRDEMNDRNLPERVDHPSIHREVDHPFGSDPDDHSFSSLFYPWIQREKEDHLGQRDDTLLPSVSPLTPMTPMTTRYVPLPMALMTTPYVVPMQKKTDVASTGTNGKKRSLGLPPLKTSPVTPPVTPPMTTPYVLPMLKKADNASNEMNRTKRYLRVPPRQNAPSDSQLLRAVRCLFLLRKTKPRLPFRCWKA